MADWDSDSATLSDNLTALLAEARELPRESVPSSAIMRQWHAAMMTGLDIPKPEWVGRFRGEAGLDEVVAFVGPDRGVEPADVATHLAEFDARLATAVDALDRVIAIRSEPTADQLSAVIDLCAWSHAEWVRIHPFANGNGRTARLWANALAMRYGLPPYVVLRPRPDDGYTHAASQAMHGDWQATIPVFRTMLRDTLEG